MLYRLLLTAIGVSIIFLSACGGGGNTAAKEADYDTTKKMVVDILQTEEGKKALAEILAKEEMKQHLVMDSDAVKESISKALTSDKSKEMWLNLFKDPKFVESYAKSMEDGQKKLFKDLMNDPDFQKQLIDVLQNPEIDKQMLQVMKGQKFRSHLEDTIKQTINSPLFLAKIQELLLEAAEKQEGNHGEEQGQNQEQGQGQGQGNQQGGGGNEGG